MEIIYSGESNLKGENFQVQMLIYHDVISNKTEALTC